MHSIHPSPLNVQNILEARPLIVLLGPTAVGKSRIAIPLAKALGTEILTADSRQVYRGLDIGTDKPRFEEQEGVLHRLIDLVEPDQVFNAGMYRRYALAEIARLHKEGRTPLVVGGTGLYIRALVRGLWEGPPADWHYRRRMYERAALHGPDSLHRELMQVDPEIAAQLHPRDQAKIIRALEAYHLLGRRLSDVHRQHAFGERPFSTLLIGLTMERTSLYRRIEARVEEQLAKGLVEEVRHLVERGYKRHLGSMRGLGYRQIAGYLAGEYSYEEAVRLIKRDTRHFAKRQMTWFRKEPGIVWLMIKQGEPAERVAARVFRLIREFFESLARQKGSNPDQQSIGTAVES